MAEDDEVPTLVCLHIANKTRPILLIRRQEECWIMGCGIPSEVEGFFSYSGNPLEIDRTLKGILDLPEGWWARRTAIGESWDREHV